MGDTPELHFQTPSKADIVLVSREKKLFRARLKTLETRCGLFEDLEEIALLADSERIDGLPSLRIDGSAEALDIVLIYVHDQEPPDMHTYDDWISAYELAHHWRAWGVLRIIRSWLPINDEKHWPTLWQLAIRTDDSSLMRCLLPFAASQDFRKDPLSFVPVYGRTAHDLVMEYNHQLMRASLRAFVGISILFGNHRDNCLEHDAVTASALNRIVTAAGSLAWRRGFVTTADFSDLQTTLSAHSCDVGAGPGTTQCPFARISRLSETALGDLKEVESQRQRHVELLRV